MNGSYMRTNHRVVPRINDVKKAYYNYKNYLYVFVFCVINTLEFAMQFHLMNRSV